LKSLEWVEDGDMGAYREKYYKDKMDIEPKDFPE
jgi:hypothetical protein